MKSLTDELNAREVARCVRMWREQAMKRNFPQCPLCDHPQSMCICLDAEHDALLHRAQEDGRKFERIGTKEEIAAPTCDDGCDVRYIPEPTGDGSITFRESCGREQCPFNAELFLSREDVEKYGPEIVRTFAEVDAA